MVTPVRMVAYTIGLVLLVISLAPAGLAGAQDDVLIEAEAPDPALCTLPAPTIDDLAALMEANADVPRETPTPLPDPFVMPEGFSLFEEERLEVEKDIHRAVACFNTGDPLKVFSTYTEGYIVQLLDRLGGLTPEVQAGLSVVRPLQPNEYIMIISFDDAILTQDGRVAIVVFGDDPADDDPPGRRLFYLEEVLPGRWLIDDIVEID
jgi:hypothetical protein